MRVERQFCCQHKFDKKWLSEAKQKTRSVASRQSSRFEVFLTRSFASRFKLRFAQLFLAKFKFTTNWPLSPQGLTWKMRLCFFRIVKLPAHSKQPKFLFFYQRTREQRNVTIVFDSEAKASLVHQRGKNFLRRSSFHVPRNKF